MEGVFFEKTKVLLIEDDQDHADLIIDILETENVNKEVITHPIKGWLDGYELSQRQPFKPI